MTSPDSLEGPRSMLALLTRLTDAITAQAMEVAAEEPRKTDGSIASPYWRGFVDGIATVSTSMASGFREAFGAFEEKHQ